ncbi:hypothetical protein OUZ56_025557 [Daphnia magna]|uniref:Uncharacterized protein n=1 Tax=Daphnia magna TaxID=35525 RepID=A0ABQ9ZK74_9CRUS|nr:hypothetical protein OUZ56_025557 [Daphnia magna]
MLEYCQAWEIFTANTSSTYGALLHPHELARAPFQVIGMDFLGPTTPVSPNGNNYFSRWVEAVALNNQTATAECTYKTIIKLKIGQRLTTAYIPASSGEIERSN